MNFETHVGSGKEAARGEMNITKEELKEAKEELKEAEKKLEKAKEELKEAKRSGDKDQISMATEYYNGGFHGIENINKEIKSLTDYTIALRAALIQDKSKGEAFGEDVRQRIEGFGFSSKGSVPGVARDIELVNYDDSEHIVHIARVSYPLKYAEMKAKALELCKKSYKLKCFYLWASSIERLFDTDGIIKIENDDDLETHGSSTNTFYARYIAPGEGPSSPTGLPASPSSNLLHQRVKDADRMQSGASSGSSRGSAQTEFRIGLMRRDHNTCVLTGLGSSLVQALEAAHIVPVSVGLESFIEAAGIYSLYDLRNGLTLLAPFHKFFDSFYWCLNPTDQSVVLSDELKVVTELKKSGLSLDQTLLKHLHDPDSAIKELNVWLAKFPSLKEKVEFSADSLSSPTVGVLNYAHDSFRDNCVRRAEKYKSSPWCCLKCGKLLKGSGSNPALHGSCLKMPRHDREIRVLYWMQKFPEKLCEPQNAQPG